MRSANRGVVILKHSVEVMFKLGVWTVATVGQCRSGMAGRINKKKWSRSMQQPELFEMLTVDERTPAIMSGGAMYQIGGILL